MRYAVENFNEVIDEDGSKWLESKDGKYHIYVREDGKHLVYLQNQEQPETYDWQEIYHYHLDEAIEFINNQA